MTDDEDEDEDTGYDMPYTARPPSPRFMELELGDPRTEAFLEDPEQNMKVFFSSHFRKQGNI